MVTRFLISNQRCQSKEGKKDVLTPFYPRDAILARVLAVIVCPSTSHAGIVSEGLATSPSTYNLLSK